MLQDYTRNHCSYRFCLCLGAASLRRAFVNQPTLEYALVPVGENGAGAATVAVDAVELVVEYRLP